jgi:hypothetical protein
MILFCALSKFMIIGVTPHVNLNRKFMTNVGVVLLLLVMAVYGYTVR